MYTVGEEGDAMSMAPSMNPNSWGFPSRGPSMQPNALHWPISRGVSRAGDGLNANASSPDRGLFSGLPQHIFFTSRLQSADLKPASSIDLPFSISNVFGVTVVAAAPMSSAVSHNSLAGVAMADDLAEAGARMSGLLSPQGSLATAAALGMSGIPASVSVAAAETEILVPAAIPVAADLSLPAVVGSPGDPVHSTPTHTPFAQPFLLSSPGPACIPGPPSAPSADLPLAPVSTQSMAQVLMDAIEGTYGHAPSMLEAAGHALLAPPPSAAAGAPTLWETHMHSPFGAALLAPSTPASSLPRSDSSPSSLAEQTSLSRDASMPTPTPVNASSTLLQQLNAAGEAISSLLPSSWFGGSRNLGGLAPLSRISEGPSNLYSELSTEDNRGARREGSGGEGLGSAGSRQGAIKALSTRQESLGDALGWRAGCSGGVTRGEPSQVEGSGCDSGSDEEPGSDEPLLDAGAEAAPSFTSLPPRPPVRATASAFASATAATATAAAGDGDARAGAHASSSLGQPAPQVGSLGAHPIAIPARGGRAQQRPDSPFMAQAMMLSESWRDTSGAGWTVGVLRAASSGLATGAGSAGGLEECPSQPWDPPRASEAGSQGSRVPLFDLSVHGNNQYTTAIATVARDMCSSGGAWRSRESLAGTTSGALGGGYGGFGRGGGVSGGGYGGVGNGDVGGGGGWGYAVPLTPGQPDVPSPRPAGSGTVTAGGAGAMIPPFIDDPLLSDASEQFSMKENLSDGSEDSSLVFLRGARGAGGGGGGGPISRGLRGARALARATSLGTPTRIGREVGAGGRGVAG